MNKKVTIRISETDLSRHQLREPAFVANWKLSLKHLLSFNLFCLPIDLKEAMGMYEEMISSNMV